MKKCPKSKPEPSLLLEYRTSQPTSTWDQMRDENPGCYKVIREKLCQDQGYLCAFCEMDLEQKNMQVSHFHPKSDTSGAINWAFHWDNLWLACKGGSQSWLSNQHNYCPPLPCNLSCDEKKGSKVLDSQVLSPCEIPAFPRIFRYEQQPDRIDICPDEEQCNIAGIPVNKVKRTINEFNLNCHCLASARLALHRQLEQAIRRLRESSTNPKEGMVSLAKNHLSKKNGRWSPFVTLVRWRLGPSAEEHLQAIGYEG